MLPRPTLSVYPDRSSATSAISRHTILTGLIVFLVLGGPTASLQAAPVTISESCAGNSITIEIDGVSNVNHCLDPSMPEACAPAEGLVDGNDCTFTYYADFPVPGKSVAVTATAGVADPDQAHELHVNFDGLRAMSDDFLYQQSCFPPPETEGYSLDPVSINTCYVEREPDFTPSVHLQTWNVVDCDVDEDGLSMYSWFTIEILPRTTYCPDGPVNCPYT